MKIKTCNLTDTALDWAVAYCADLPFPVVYDEDGREVAVSPSTDWAQGGPIIEREEIELVPKGMYWDAYADEDFHVPHSGPTPLIAAMRCYVASKLGDEVEIPEGLIK